MAMELTRIKLFRPDQSPNQRSNQHRQRGGKILLDIRGRRRLCITAKLAANVSDGSKNGPDRPETPFPVYPEERTSSEPVGMSQSQQYLIATNLDLITIKLLLLIIFNPNG